MSTEYVDDVPYVRQFVPDLSPARLRMIAALNGVTPPPSEDFDYCELGCAHGDTLAALAAAHPTSRFLGIDLSAQHVASAKRLARDGALENVGVLQRDFSDLVDDDIGEFDYIVAHGVLSWVGPDTRAAAIAFARSKLKPGGLLHVSYNAMPGWASVEPLRQLLLFGGAGSGPSPTSSLERARRGLELARAMEQAGADYFAKNPSASEMLATMTRAGLPYVIHEYLHEHWIPMYFARVAWEMGQSGLRFVGSLPPSSNLRETAISEAQEKLHARVIDRLTFESLKDFATDEFFRRDVFVKARGADDMAIAASPSTPPATLDGVLWGTLTRALPAGRDVKLPHRTVTLDDPLLATMHAALARGATSLSALARSPEFAGTDLDVLRAALVRLVVTEQVIPTQTRTRFTETDPDQRFHVPLPYNQTMLRRLASDTPVVLASTHAGTAFQISALEGLALRVLTESEPGQREAWIDAHLGRSVLRIRSGDHVLEDRADQKRALQGVVASLRGEWLAKLVEYGILAPRGTWT